MQRRKTNDRDEPLVHYFGRGASLVRGFLLLAGITLGGLGAMAFAKGILERPVNWGMILGGAVMIAFGGVELLLLRRGAGRAREQ